MYISLWILISIWMSGRPSVLMMSSIWYNNNFSLQHIFKPFSTALFFGYHAYIDLHGMLNFLGCVILLDIYVDNNIVKSSTCLNFDQFSLNNVFHVYYINICCIKQTRFVVCLSVADKCWLCWNVMYIVTLPYACTCETIFMKYYHYQSWEDML